MFLDYMYDVLYSLTISQERISTLISFNSSISRVGSFVILALNGVLLESFNIKEVVGLNFEVAVSLSLIIGFLFLYSVGKTKRSKVKV